MANILMTDRGDQGFNFDILHRNVEIIPDANITQSSIRDERQPGNGDVPPLQGSQSIRQLPSRRRGPVLPVRSRQSAQRLP